MFGHWSVNLDYISQRVRLHNGTAGNGIVDLLYRRSKNIDII